MKSVKLGEEAKILFETIQAKVYTTMGRKILKRELLKTMIEFSSRRLDQFIGESITKQAPFTEDEIAQLLLEPKDWGIDTSEECSHKNG